MIEQLEQQFEQIKDKFSNGDLIAIFAKFDIEKMLDKIENALDLLKDLEKEDPMKQRYIALKKQVVEFDEFLAGFLVQDNVSV